MSGPNLHFGITSSTGAEETAREAKWMEDLGYEYFAAGEHYMRGDPPGPSHASLPILGVAIGSKSGKFLNRVGVLRDDR